MVSKKSTMESTSSKNLDDFTTKYRVGAEYALVPVFPERGGPRVRFDLAMMKRHLVIRPAWEIGEHDPDSIAIDRMTTPSFLPT